MITLRDGRRVQLGPLEISHAEMYYAYMVKLAGDTPWSGTLPDEVRSIDKQRERIEKDARSSFDWVLAAFDPASNEIIADCSWSCIDYEKFRHVASLGIGIVNGWRGCGLGRILMERSIESVRVHPSVLKIELGVFEGNTVARRLYESLGFEVEGARKKAVRQSDGELVDDIIMGLWLGDCAS